MGKGQIKHFLIYSLIFIIGLLPLVIGPGKNLGFLTGGIYLAFVVMTIVPSLLGFGQIKKFSEIMFKNSALKIFINSLIFVTIFCLIHYFGNSPFDFVTVGILIYIFSFSQIVFQYRKK